MVEGPADTPATTSEKFLGVPGEALRAIGCLSVAAARLEWTIRSIAVDLLIPANDRQSSDLLKRIRRGAADGLPRHARLTSHAVLVDWTRKAGDALYERHVPSHSAAAYQGNLPVLVHLRSGKVAPMDTSALMASANRIVKIDNEGSALNFALRNNPRPGVYLPNAVSDEKWIPTCSTDQGGADMARPTDAELDEWWQTYGPMPRI